ncbi:MAG: hypothetical protein HeimC2_29070 [Candidatus Heimdallarchaeota archaeon LC_2]|nr:MAG: hypothetical protein HeimC2_29070 [Candidatus Heimdallarchaeota archaeon LC_2]
MTDVNSIFETTMRELWKVATQDGIITPEEKDILEQVQIDAVSYAVMLEECIQRGTITKEEASKLDYLKNLITDRAYVTATIDGKVDRDERNLIAKLAEVISIHYNLNLK